MLDRDHPLVDLQTAAALASRWPTLHAFADDEEAVEALRARLEAVLGPLPQADVIEPWSPDDPEPRWELRVDLPDLDDDGWAAVARALPAAVLVPGVREGGRAADDGGLRHDELLEAGGIVARMRHDDDGSLSPDLARAGGGDAEIATLEAELCAAVREVDPALGFRSDRGPDTVAPIVHRSTGRFGVQLAFDVDAFEGLDGDEVARRREALLAAVGRVVAARASHPVLRLASDLLWDVPMGGLVLTTWIVAPAVPPLPLDDAVPPGASPAGPALDTLLADVSQVEDLELQAVPDGPGAHDAAVERITARLSAGSLPVAGGMPRWLRVGGGWAFCPVWRILADGVDPRLVRNLLADLARTEGVAAVRLVPGEPVGLGDVWSCCEPAWTWGPLRCLVRVRDGLLDRDRLPESVPRARTPRDAAVEVQVFAALVASEGAAALVGGPVGPGHAIRDTGGRDGLELVFDAGSFSEEPLRAALRAVGAAGDPDLAPVVHYAHRHDRTVVRLWYRGEGEPPRWR